MMRNRRKLRASGAGCLIPEFKNIHPTGGNMTAYLPKSVSDALIGGQEAAFANSTLYAYSMKTGKVVGAGECVCSEQSFPIWWIDKTPNSTVFGAEDGERIGFRVENNGKIYDLISGGSSTETTYQINGIFDIRATRLAAIECTEQEGEAEDSGITSTANPYIKYVLYGAAAWIGYKMFIKK
tara:strand:- start:3970 stop:4515 length:546 start_codon:yes stop_codon:yes gene_type:complete